MLGSLGYDWAGLTDKLIGAATNITLADKQMDIEKEKAKQAQAMAAAATGMARPPAISRATKIGLTIGIPAVILLGVALFMKGRK